MSDSLFPPPLVCTLPTEFLLEPLAPSHHPLSSGSCYHYFCPTCPRPSVFGIGNPRILRFPSSLTAPSHLHLFHLCCTDFCQKASTDVFWEIESHNVAQTAFELKIFLPLPLVITGMWYPEIADSYFLSTRKKFCFLFHFVVLDLEPRVSFTLGKHFYL